MPASCRSSATIIVFTLIADSMTISHGQLCERMRRKLLERFEEVAAFDDGGLDDLGETFAKRAPRERLQRRDVAEHRDRIAKAPARFFPARRLTPVLPPMAASTIATERRRDVRVAMPRM